MTKIVCYETVHANWVSYAYIRELLSNMKLTTKGRYAVTALLDMAIHIEKAPFTVAELAKRQGISQLYLERLTGILRAKGILESIKGPGGGYFLNRSPESITIADIINAVNEPIDATRCNGKSNCQQGETCLTHELWSELNSVVLQFLESITLAELANRQNIRAIAARQGQALKTPVKLEKERMISSLIKPLACTSEA